MLTGPRSGTGRRAGLDRDDDRDAPATGWGGRLAGLAGGRRPDRAGPDEPARLAEAAWSLYAHGAGTVVVDGLIAGRRSCRVWRLAAVGPGGTRQYALKWFRPGRPAGGGTGPAVAAEYAALVDLAGALDHPPVSGAAGWSAGYRVGCPTPVQAWDWGYLMSAVPGQRLDQVLLRGLLPRVEQPGLAVELVRALAAFHARHGGPYGEFEPANVLLGPGRVGYLLAPGPDRGGPGAAPPGAPPLAADVAYWAFRTALHGLRQSVRHPRTVAECHRFARELRHAAAGGDPAVDAQIARCLTHYRGLLRRHGPRHRALAAATARLLDPDRPPP